MEIFVLFLLVINCCLEESKCQYQIPPTLKIPNENAEFFVLGYSKKDANGDLLECKNNAIRRGALGRLNNTLRILALKEYFGRFHQGIH